MLSPEIRRFAENVVRDAKREALSKFSKGTGKLANSITFKPFTQGKNIEGVSFEMEDYGPYKDAGVFGANPSLVKNGKQKGKKTNSVLLGNRDKFQYKSLRPPMQSLRNYVQANKIRFRTPKGESGGGQFRAGSYTTIAYWMAKRIYAQGLAPTLFFTKPFIKHFQDLPDEIAEQFAEQLEKQLKKE